MNTVPWNCHRLQNLHTYKLRPVKDFALWLALKIVRIFPNVDIENVWKRVVIARLCWCYLVATIAYNVFRHFHSQQLDIHGVLTLIGLQKEQIIQIKNL